MGFFGAGLKCLQPVIAFDNMCAVRANTLSFMGEEVMD